MSQSNEGKYVDAKSTAAAESRVSHGARPEGVPESNFHARMTPDAALANLALCLSGDLSHGQIISQASSVLSALLPNCCVEILVHGDGSRASSTTSADSSGTSALLASEALQSSVRSLGRCEWHLLDDPEGPILLVTLERVRHSRELARVLDIGERAAVLLGAAWRREALRQRLATQAEELGELRQRVIQSDKLAGYGQLVASGLHDLSSPLTAILAYAEYLTKTLGAAGVGPADMSRLARIREAAESALKQTRELVEYSCPPRTPFVNVDLTSCIQRALCLCEHELSRAGVTVRCQLDATIPTIRGHAEHLTQLFVNLFTNAAHAASPLDAKVDVESSVVQDRRALELKVRDNGHGIQATDIEHVFDPFYTTRGASGCGLGLAIVKDIAEHHGGSVGVTSNPLVGTTFVLTLPLGDTVEDPTTER